MKKLAVLFLAICSITALQAKDVSFQVVNNHDVAIKLFIGAISSKDNTYTDEELVQNRETMGIEATGRSIGGNKKTQISKNDLANNQLLVIFGLFEIGGRTELFRYRVKDIEGKFTVTFEGVKTYKPSLSYTNIVKQLMTTKDHGKCFSAGKTIMTGRFLSYNISSENYDGMYILSPVQGTEVTKTMSEDNEVSDLLLKESTLPFYGTNGKLSDKVPTETDAFYSEVSVAGYDKVLTLFGEKTYKFLTWQVFGSFNMEAKPKDSSFLNLYKSIKESERKYVLSQVLGGIGQEKISYHLFYIISTHRIDSLVIINKDYDKLTETDQIAENDLVTPKGIFRLNGDESVIFTGTNLVKNVMAVDLTPLLYYTLITETKFSKTVSSAEQCMNLYKELSNFMELPALDGTATEVSDPLYTINQVKQYINDPKVLTTIESRLNKDAYVPIPEDAVPKMKLRMENPNKW